MNLDKKQWTMLIAGVVALFLVYWLFFRKKKTTESGYDDAVMIMGDSSYDPAFPEIGGRESNFRSGGAKKCSCGSANETGTCMKSASSGLLECRGGSIIVPPSPSAIGERGISGGPVKNGGCPKGTKPTTCWDENNKPFTCCDPIKGPLL